MSESYGVAARFRLARNQDAEEVRELLFDVLKEFNLEAEHKGVDADLDDIEGNYIHGGGTFEIAENPSGEIIGMVGLFPRTKEVCELRKMYLVPAERGKGIGREMLERMLKLARRNGFRRMELETASVLEKAIALYRGYGFMTLDAHEVCARCDAAFALDL